MELTFISVTSCVLYAMLCAIVVHENSVLHTCFSLAEYEILGGGLYSLYRYSSGEKCWNKMYFSLVISVDLNQIMIVILSMMFFLSLILLSC